VLRFDWTFRPSRSARSQGLCKKLSATRPLVRFANEFRRGHGAAARLMAAAAGPDLLSSKDARD